MDSVTDQSLINETLAGNSQAFDQLVYRYQDRLVHSLSHSLGSRDDALDVAQQAFVQAWRKLDTFRGDSAFYSWLYRIARNVAVNRLRREATKPTTSLNQIAEGSGFDPVDASDTASPEYQLEQSETLDLVRSALWEIAEDFRQPLVMKEIDGFSYEEISGILDIPLGTVRSRIFRARQELTERLQRLLKNEQE